MTNTLANDLLSLCTIIGDSMPLPAVHHVYFPPHTDKIKSRKFGLVTLADQSTGFFFSLLENPDDRPPDTDMFPRDALELAHWFEREDITTRAVGLGAIGAITRSLYNRTGFQPPEAPNPLAGFDFSTNDHVGMIGFFPGLIDKLRANGIPLTVLELEEEYVQKTSGFEVTIDPTRLRSCNKILCTASTLINNTVDEILANVEQAERVAVVGPSAGCMPDPLFERGISVVGGTTVNDYAALRTHCENGSDWEKSVSKCCLDPASYPGTIELVERLRKPGRTL